MIHYVKILETGVYPLNPLYPQLYQTMGAVISLHHSSKVLCRRDVNSGSWRVRSLTAPPLFWSLILPEMTTSKMARITMLVNKLTIQCEWHSSKSLGSTLTSGTFKYTHTALHDSYFESLGNLEMYLNLTSWQSIDIWTHSWCLCLSFLKHNFFFFFFSRVNILRVELFFPVFSH